MWLMAFLTSLDPADTTVVLTSDISGARWENHSTCIIYWPLYNKTVLWIAAVNHIGASRYYCEL